jgi:hypothetical protein
MRVAASLAHAKKLEDQDDDAVMEMRLTIYPAAIVAWVVSLGASLVQNRLIGVLIGLAALGSLHAALGLAEPGGGLVRQAMRPSALCGLQSAHY